MRVARSGDRPGGKRKKMKAAIGERDKSPSKDIRQHWESRVGRICRMKVPVALLWVLEPPQQPRRMSKKM